MIFIRQRVEKSTNNLIYSTRFPENRSIETLPFSKILSTVYNYSIPVANRISQLFFIIEPSSLNSRGKILKKGEKQKLEKPFFPQLVLALHSFWLAWFASHFGYTSSPPHFCRASPPTRDRSSRPWRNAGHRRLWLDRYQEYTRTALTWVNRRWKLNPRRTTKATPSARTEITYWPSNTVPGLVLSPERCTTHPLQILISGPECFWRRGETSRINDSDLSLNSLERRSLLDTGCQRIFGNELLLVSLSLSLDLSAILVFFSQRMFVEDMILIISTTDICLKIFCRTRVSAAIVCASWTWYINLFVNNLRVIQQGSNCCVPILATKLLLSWLQHFRRWFRCKFPIYLKRYLMQRRHGGNVFKWFRWI